jgi:hypothetical protein
MLVGHALETDAMTEVLVVRRHHTAVQHQRVDGIGRQRVDADLIALVGLPEVIEDFRRESTVGTRGSRKQRRYSEEQE